MNAPPLLLLIRPQRQSEQLLAECEAAIGVSVLAKIIPIMKIVPRAGQLNLNSYQGVIATSRNTIRFAGDLTDIRLYCVGNRTRLAAERAGGDVLFTAPNAQNLLTHLKAQPPVGRLIYLHGEHVTIDLQKMLVSAGIETENHILYRQIAEPVSDVLRAGVSGDRRAVLPLYSPRSARLLGEGVEGLGAGLHVIAISQAVADAWRKATGGDCEVCGMPDSEEMLGRIVTALKR